jgi:hypothetical protein
MFLTLPSPCRHELLQFEHFTDTFAPFASILTVLEDQYALIHVVLTLASTFEMHFHIFGAGDHMMDFLRPLLRDSSRLLTMNDGF